MTDYTREEGEKIERYIESGDMGLAQMAMSMAKGIGIPLERLAELAEARRNKAIKDFQVSEGEVYDGGDIAMYDDDKVIRYEEGKLDWIWWRWIEAVIFRKRLEETELEFIDHIDSPPSIHTEKEEEKKYKEQKKRVQKRRKEAGKLF